MFIDPLKSRGWGVGRDLRIVFPMCVIGIMLSPVLPVIKFAGVFSQCVLGITVIRVISSLEAQVLQSNRPRFESGAAIY